MSAAVDDLVILAVESDRVIARHHNLLLIVRRRPPTVEELAVMRTQTDLLARQFPSGFVILQASFISGSGLPSERDREAMADFLRSATDKLLLLAIVVPSGGFALAAVRSVVLGMKMVGGARAKYAVFGDLREAVTQACQTAQPHTPESLAIEPVLQHMERLRLMMQATP